VRKLSVAMREMANVRKEGAGDQWRCLSYSGSVQLERMRPGLFAFFPFDEKPHHHLLNEMFLN